MGAQRSLLAQFNIDVNTAKLLAADSQLGQFIEKVRGMNNSMYDAVRNLRAWAAAAAIAFAAKGLFDFVEGQVQAAVKLKRTADQLGITTTELQKWQYAAGSVGADADGAVRAFGLLNRTLGQAALGNKSYAKAYAQLGIDIKDTSTGAIKPAQEVALELADKLKGMNSQAERTAAVTKVMGRGAIQMLPLLQQGSEELLRVFTLYDKLGGGMHDDFIKAAEETNRRLNDMNLVFTHLKERLAFYILPLFNQVVDVLTNVSMGLIALADSSYVVQTALMAIAAIAAIMLLPLLLDLGILLLALAPIWVPLFALYLLFDDIYTMINGGHSIIGTLIDDIFGLGASKIAVVDLKAAFEVLKGVLLVVFETFRTGYRQMFDLLGTLAHRTVLIARLIKDSLTLDVKDQDLVIKELFSADKYTDDHAKAGADWVDKVAALAGPMQDALLGDQVTYNRDDPRNPDYKKTHDAKGKYTGPQVAVSNTNHFHIAGAQNPRDTAAAVQNVMQDQNSDDMEASFQAMSDFGGDSD